jgi:tripartite ATP-independent transporter DctM subunit
MLFVGVPVAFAMGFSAITVIGLAHLGLLAVPTNFYSGIAKYPLLTIPMFVLAGTIFERSGVAERLVRLAVAIVGNRRGALAVVAVVIAMLLGGTSGSGAAITAVVAGIMGPSLAKAGYPAAFSSTVIAAASTTDILIPPSITLIIYSVLVPQATTTAMFAAGLIPGTLAGLLLIGPVWSLALYYRFGEGQATESRPPFWKSLLDAFWGLMAKVVILGGLRLGIFTPTEAAVAAVFYSLFVGVCIYRSIAFTDLYKMLVEAAEISSIILLVIAFAGVFAWVMDTLSAVDPFVKAILSSGLGEYGVLALLVLLLIVVGIFLDGVSICVVMLPLLIPIAQAFKWDLVWFGIIMTIMVAIGQIHPPIAVNLMVACKITSARIEDTIFWAAIFIIAFLILLLLVVMFPQLALWLPREMGFY